MRFTHTEYSKYCGIYKKEEKKTGAMLWQGAFFFRLEHLIATRRTASFSLEVRLTSPAARTARGRAQLAGGSTWQHLSPGTRQRLTTSPRYSDFPPAAAPRQSGLPS